jgi:hypothetical protein
VHLVGLDHAFAGGADGEFQIHEHNHRVLVGEELGGLEVGNVHARLQRFEKGVHEVPALERLQPGHRVGQGVALPVHVAGEAVQNVEHPAGDPGCEAGGAGDPLSPARSTATRLKAGTPQSAPP